MNWKKGIAVALSAISIMAMVAGCGSNTATNDQKKIGVIQLVEHPSLDAANKGFVDGLASKGYKDGENIKLDQQNAQADQSNLNSIAQRFVSDKKDLVLAIATPAAQTMANASHDIPIMGTAITDYVTAKLVQSNEHPGGNVSGTSDMTPVESGGRPVSWRITPPTTMTGGATAMRHTVSDGSGRYDPLDIASLQLWQQGQQEDNRQQIRRLLVNLPLAVAGTRRQ